MHRLQDMDRAYANGAFVAGSQALPGIWLADAGRFRAAVGQRARLGLSYGPADRNRFDLFLPVAAPLGLMVFVHGGYWLEFGRESWSHFAAGALARGWACAMPSYTLAPAARLATITVEIAMAVKAAAALVAGPVVVAGHSAGGHLAARMACQDMNLILPDRLQRVVPISPIADLLPLTQTRMNAALHLTPAEVAAESPARLPLRPGLSVHVWVGAMERPAFLWQARVLSEEWGCDWTADPGRNHFDVIDGLKDADSPLMQACLGAWPTTPAA